MTASDLKTGQSAKILSLKEGILNQKLSEMGCVPGTIIELEFKSPAGDPLAFSIDGYLLGLRKNEADYLEVELNLVG